MYIFFAMEETVEVTLSDRASDQRAAVWHRVESCVLWRCICDVLGETIYRFVVCTAECSADCKPSLMIKNAPSNSCNRKHVNQCQVNNSFKLDSRVSDEKNPSALKMWVFPLKKHTHIIARTEANVLAFWHDVIGLQPLACSHKVIHVNGFLL